MMKKKILFVSQEMNPYLEITNLANITRKLPQITQEKGYEIRILMPRFGNVNERRNRLHEVIRLSGINISIDDNDNQLIIKVASLPSARMQVYFLDNDDYFSRRAIFTDDNDAAYADNDERMIFFNKGVLETVKKLGWMPDIIHCHGFMSSLLPMYLKTGYHDEPMFRNAKTIYSVYENDYNLPLANTLAEKCAVHSMTVAETSILAEPTISNLHINAMKYADSVIVGSENIAPEVEAYLQTITDKTVIPFSDAAADGYEQYLNLYEELCGHEVMI